MHPLPVPISKIDLEQFKYLKICSTIISVSGLGIRTLELIIKEFFQNSFF